MTDPTAATHPPTEPSIEEQTQWFGASNRPAGTEPDTRYGWLNRGQQVYIVKALNQTQVHYGVTLLDYERKALTQLNRFKAPVPALWDETSQALPNGWLATQFSGLSLQRLSLPGTPDQHAGLPPLEQWACWVHFLERAQGMAVAGIIPIDLWAANLVVPFTEDASGQPQLSGQLKLNGVINIDHAHTVAAGWNMRRPVWLAHQMKYIAPELHGLLIADRLALLQHFANQGLPLSQAGHPLQTDAASVARSRQLWLDYSQPQQLQQAVDATQVNAHHVIQYAVGTDLRDQRLPALLAHRPQCPQWPQLQNNLQAVLACMTHKDPTQRYATLQDAATALRKALPSVPLAGAVHYPTVGPHTLRPPTATAPPPQPPKPKPPTPKPAASTPAQPPKPTKTAPTPPKRSTPSQNPRNNKPLYLALALGCALGVVLVGLLFG